VQLKLGARPRVRRVALHLPGRVDGGVVVLANGEPANRTVKGRTVRVSLPLGRLRSLTLAAGLGGRRPGNGVVVTMRGGKLVIPLS
jgi:hypothetical protein